MERVIIGTKEIIEYRGSCPDCGVKQKSFSYSAVDIPCCKCGKKRKEKQIREKYEHLIDGTVVIVYGHNNLKSIRIKAKDGKEYDITSHREFGESDEYLNVHKVASEE